MNIKHIPGNIVKKDGTNSDILTLLGISPTAIDYVNDGRGQTISAIEIGGNQYAVSEVLEYIASSLTKANYGLDVEITDATGGTYKVSETFEKMKTASPLNITYKGNPAAEVTYTKSGSTITAIVARFLTFGTDEMSVKTFTINGSGVTAASVTYSQTEAT